MFKILQKFFLIQISLVIVTAYADASILGCEKIFKSTNPSTAQAVVDARLGSKNSLFKTVLTKVKLGAVDQTLNLMGYIKGLPKYLKRIQELQKSGRYLEYSNFGEMGLAELDISVRYNMARLGALDTGRPLIIVANHPLGIVDGLALQYLSSHARKEKPSLLLLARWIEHLLPKAIFGDKDNWGTAIPVEINKPQESDPLYETKMAELNSFNSLWNRTSLKVLRRGGALIIFPAGHVASMNKDSGTYPDNVYDAPGSWHHSVLSLARLGKADIAFANIDSVNSQSFYKNRKRFGGGDKERVVWFFSEAIGKKGKAVDVFLSEPMGLDAIYSKLSQQFSYSKDELQGSPELTIELMRQYTHELSSLSPQELNTTDSPQKIGRTTD